MSCEKFLFGNNALNKRADHATLGTELSALI